MMKTLRALAALPLVTGLMLGCTTTLEQAAVDQATIDAVKALWQTQHKALDAHDIGGLMATYADTDDIMLMGTGPGEHWVGPEAVKEAYRRFMGDFDANTLTSQCGEGSGSRRNGVLWFTGVCDFADRSGRRERRYLINLSAVVVQQDDGWRFHTMHFSHLTGN
jgi:ketosteroid isomerase-like protein